MDAPRCPHCPHCSQAAHSSPPTPAQALGYKLVHLRLLMRLTRDEAADRIGVPPASLARMETGTSDAPLREIEALFFGDPQASDVARTRVLLAGW